MDLRAWIRDEHAAAASRFERSIMAAVPLERWRETGRDGWSSIAFLTFHVAYHEDVAMNAVLCGGMPLLASWRDQLGLQGVEGHVGLAEAEPRQLTGALQVDALVPYVDAVHASTASWLGAVDLGSLDDRPDAATALAAAGVAETAVSWLYAMWAEQPVSWFVQWEAIGHRVNHIGEMIAVRNRMGLSPF